MWSFGVVLYEVITYGKTPYPAMTNGEVLVALEEKRYRMQCPNVCPEKLYEIMLDCWGEEPESRPTFDTLHWILDDYYVVTENGYTEPAS